MAADFELDAVDRRILAALQSDGRMSYEQLAAQAHLSPSAALRRVKRLEEAGVIAGYVALVRAERIGLTLTAYISVRMEKQAGGDKRSPMDDFSAAVQAWPEVVECVSMAGEMDYLLRVVVSGMDHYSRFVMDTLLRHPSVQDCKTSFVLSSVKATTVLPV
jgi:Lrp/AsnC family transcriptional regulator, leucine-responsive regulatory protein